MCKILPSVAKVSLFYLIAIGLSIAFSLLSVVLDQSFWIGIPTMLTPTVAVLIMLLVITREGYTKAVWRQLGLLRFGWSLWPLAIIAPLFLLTLTAAGIFYGYLRLRSGSVWPGALAHSVFNTVLEALMGLTVPISVVGMEYLAGESGVISLLLLIAIVSVLLRRLAASDVSTSLSERPGERPVASMVLPN